MLLIKLAHTKMPFGIRGKILIDTGILCSVVQTKGFQKANWESS
jgi:uncharacterized protein (DUF3820 family)